MLSKDLKAQYERWLSVKWENVRFEVLPYCRVGQPERYTVLVDDCAVFRDWSPEELQDAPKMIHELVAAVEELLSEIVLPFDAQEILASLEKSFPGNTFAFDEVQNNGVILVMKLRMNGKPGITGRLTKQQIKEMAAQYNVTTSHVIYSSLAHILAQAALA